MLETSKYSNFDESELEIPSSLNLDFNDTELTFFERISHSRFQVRKRLYQEFIDYLSVGAIPQDFPHPFIDSFSPWLNNIVNDQNMICLSDGLKLLELFVTQFNLNKTHLAYFLPDLLNRAAHLKHNMQNQVIEIVMKCNSIDKSQTFLFEFSRNLSKKQPKNLQIQLQILNLVIQGQDLASDQFIQLLKNLSKHLEHNSHEIRNLTLEVISRIYSLIDDNAESFISTFFSSQRQIIHKELLTSLSKTSKSPSLGLKLCTGIDGEQKKLNDGPLDLYSLLPEKFFEVPYIFDPNEKKKIIEEFNGKLHFCLSQGTEFDKNKDYSQLFPVIVSVCISPNTRFLKNKTFLSFLKDSKPLIPLFGFSIEQYQLLN